MDEYTKKTKIWLDEQFNLSDKQGVYFAHQPIYGFQKGHCHPHEDMLIKYVPTWQIMKALSHIEFNSLLDVGGAEGYKAALVREIFDASVINSDLSREACKRAEEIFGIKSDSIDIHNLPYKENQFDVIVCSETLEHVTDFSKAISELLRVAAKAVVITVPHDSNEYVQDNIRKKEIHGHIKVFDIKSFNFLKEKGYHVFSKKILSPYSYLFLWKFRKKKLVMSFLITLDEFISKLFPKYGGILIIVSKNTKGVQRKKKANVSAYRILNFSVPEYYLRHNKDHSTG